MKIEDCKIDQIVYFHFGKGVMKKGIIIGFDKNFLDEDVCLVQWFANGMYNTPWPCHPANFQENEVVA